MTEFSKMTDCCSKNGRNHCSRMIDKIIKWLSENGKWLRRVGPGARGRFGSYGVNRLTWERFGAWGSIDQARTTLTRSVDQLADLGDELMSQSVRVMNIVYIYKEIRAGEPGWRYDQIARVTSRFSHGTTTLREKIGAGRGRGGGKAESYVLNEL
jgi:hypothetical protein